MNKIDSIIIHCSATRAGLDLRAKDIDCMHRQRGFTRIGYNFVIDLDGNVENGRPLSIDGAHCNTKGFSGVSYNKHSIGICYIGGLDVNGRRQIPGQKRRRTLFVIWLQSCVKNMISLSCLDIAILLLILMTVVKLNRENISKAARASMCEASLIIFCVTQL